MTVTFATRLAGPDGRNLRMYVTIEGVRHVLQDDDDDVPTALIASTRTRVKCIATIEQERRELDLVARRAKGGGLRLRLLDDSAHTLRSIFSMRKRRATFITANVTAAQTVVTVKSTRAFSSDGEFWVGGECVSYTGTTATTFTGCTRGAYGTEARPFRGGSLNGQAVYSSPPSWLGRTVTLTGYFLEADGSAPTSTAMQEVLGTFDVDSAPSYVGGDEWELSAVDRIDGYLKKAIYSGVEQSGSIEMVTEGDVSTGNAHGFVRRDPDLLMLFGISSASALGDDAYVVAERPDANTGDMRSYLVRAVTVTATNGATGPFPTVRVDFNLEPGLNRRLEEHIGGQGNVRFKSLRAVAYLREKADVIAMKVLTSRAGDSGNGAYDLLRGRLNSTATDGEPDVLGWRIGAGILAANIDTASFAAVGGDREWFFVVSEPSTIGDFLRDFCIATDSFIVTNALGQLAAKPLSSTAASVATIDDDALIGDSEAKAFYDEGNVYPSIVLECGYHHGDAEFTRRIEVHDSEMAERFPHRDETLTLQSRSIYLSGVWSNRQSAFNVPLMSLTQIQAMVRRFQSDEGGRGSLYVDARVTIDHALLDLADVVTLTVTDVPNMEGGTIAAARARVVSIVPVWSDGVVDLRLHILRGPKVIAPAAIIDSVAGNVLTLHNDPPESHALPGNMFAIGNKVLVWDVSGNASFATTLTAVGAGTVTLNALPGFGIADDIDFITHDVVSGLDVAPTVNGYVPLSDFVYQVDDDEGDYEADIPLAGESRWR